MQYKEQSVSNTTNASTEAWKILYIPDKPPVPPTQQPTVNMFASAIEPKLANALIRRLNQVCPLEEFRHVKRIRKQNVEGGRMQLSVILCLAIEDEYSLNSFPKDIQELISSYQLSPFLTKVCKYAATSREEWEEQCKLWPTSYHPPTYNIDGITGFNEEESQWVFRFMKAAIELAKSGDGSIVNAAVIVDPSVQQIIARGCDQIGLWQSPTDMTRNGCSSLIQPGAPSSHPRNNGETRHITMLPNDSFDKPERLYTGISCVNPWQWQELCTSFCNWHPLRHAAMVAIESSAYRDRRLFPGFGHDGERPFEAEPVQSSSLGSLAKRQKTNLEKENCEKELDAPNEDSHPVLVRPYLCTNFDIYLVWEPCIMCAMALVHQRIRRIFYAFPNASAGALGSIHRLQGEKSLNHHYAVFRVVLPEGTL